MGKPWNRSVARVTIGGQTELVAIGVVNTRHF